MANKDFKSLADKDKQRNDILIKKTITEHLKVEDEKSQEIMEKILIYNLMN